MASPVHRLPPELIRKMSDQLVGIKQWATPTDTPCPVQTTPFAPTGRIRAIDFVGLRTLPSLATASRFFLEPALDALWDTLPDYGILVYLLPRDAWATRTDTIQHLGDYDRRPEYRYVSITRELTEDEFERVEYYTPRVKRIQEFCPLFPNRFHGYVTHYESSVLATFVPRWTATKPLFPNLRILDVSPTHIQYPLYYRFSHILLGPQLQRISSHCTMVKLVPPTDYQQMLERLQESAPHLLHLNLSVDAPPYSSVIVSAMSTALCSFIYLVSARTDALPITEQAFRHLAELPHLEAIDICLDTITEASFNRARFDEFFPNLRELPLSHSFSLGLISLVVQCVKAPRLEIIGARLLDDDVFVPLDTAMSLFSAIFSVKNSERIQELEIEATIEGTITAQHLEPLFALRRLTSLQLHLQCTFDLDDEVLGRAARAWRNIRVLELGPFAPQWKTSVTLTVLVAFAQHCPKLQTLGLTIDAANISYVHYEYWYGQVHAACVQRELRVLNVGRACII